MPLQLAVHTQAKDATFTVVKPATGGRGNIVCMSSLCFGCLFGWCWEALFCSDAILNVLAEHVISK